MTAKENYVSLQSLSKLINELENKFGVELFIKKRNLWILTEQGETIYNNINKVLLAYNTFENTLEEIKKNKKKITLAIAHYLDYSNFHSFLYFLIKNNPDIEFKIQYLSSNEIKKLLNENKIDIGFYITLETKISYVKAFNSVFLRREELFYLVGNNHSLANNKSISIKEISQQNTAMLEKYSGTIEPFKESFNQLGLNLNLSFYPAHSHISHELLSGNKGSICVKGFLCLNENISFLKINPNLYFNFHLGFNNKNKEILEIITFIEKNFNNFF